MIIKKTFQYLFLFLLSSAALAEIPKPDQKAIQKIKKQYAGLMSEGMYKFIERANSLASGKNYKEAVKVLRGAINSSNVRAGEKPQIMRALGFIYAQKGDFNQSNRWLQKSLKTKKLSYNLHLSTLYTIAQITVAQKEYEKAKQILEELFSISEKPNPQAYVLYAACLLEGKKGEVDEALKYVEQAIALVNKPQEGWLKFATFLHLKKAHWKKAQNLLEILVAQFPDREIYWRLLAKTYIYLDDNKKALITLNLAHSLGYLKTENDYLFFSHLLLSEGIPFKAAKILESSLSQKKIKNTGKNIELMADAFLEARELKSSLNLFSQIINKTDKTDTFIKYSFLLLQEEQWKKAEKILEKTLILIAQKESVQGLNKEVILNSQKVSKQSLDKEFLNSPEIASSQKKPKQSTYKNLVSSFQKKFKSIKNKYLNRDTTTASIKNEKQEQAFKPSSIKPNSFKNEKQEQARQAAELATIKSIAQYEAPKVMPTSFNPQDAIGSQQDAVGSQKNKKYTGKKDKIYLGLGIALFYQKRYEEALEHFRSSFKLNSEQSEAFHWIQHAENMIKEQNKLQNASI